MLDRVFVVSLARRPDRRRAMVQRLTHVRAPVEFVDAVDGNDVDDEYLGAHGYGLFPRWHLAASDNVFYARELRAGEIACSLSHLEVWRRARRDRLAVSLVLEDDAAPEPGFEDLLERRLADLAARGEPWGLLYLGRQRRDVDEAPAGQGLVVARFSYCTHAYAFTLACAERLLDAGLERAIVPVDEFLPAMYCPHPREDVRVRFGPGNAVRALALCPDVVTQADGGDSETEQSLFVVPPEARARRLVTSPDLRVTRTSDEVRLEVVGSPSGLSLPAEDADGVLAFVDRFANGADANEVCSTATEVEVARELVATLVAVGALRTDDER